MNTLATIPAACSHDMGDFLLVASVGFAAAIVLTIIGHIFKWWSFTIGRAK
jgi:hypothetical protein